MKILTLLVMAALTQVLQAQPIDASWDKSIRNHTTKSYGTFPGFVPPYLYGIRHNLTDTEIWKIVADKRDEVTKEGLFFGWTEQLPLYEYAVTGKVENTVNMVLTPANNEFERKRNLDTVSTKVLAFAQEHTLKERKLYVTSEALLGEYDFKKHGFLLYGGFFSSYAMTAKCGINLNSYIRKGTKFENVVLMEGERGWHHDSDERQVGRFFLPMGESDAEKLSLTLKELYSVQLRYSRDCLALSESKMLSSPTIQHTTSPIIIVEEFDIDFNNKYISSKTPQPVAYLKSYWIYYLDKSNHWALLETETAQADTAVASGSKR